MAKGSAFTSSWDSIHSGFGRVALGMSMDPAQLQDVMLAFGEGLFVGDDHLLISRVSASLAAGDWSWPWFDTCSLVLEGEQAWPLRWQRDGLPPGTVLADLRQDLRGRYLVDTLKAAVSCASLVALMSSRAFNRAYRRTLMTGDSACPAENLMCGRARPEIEAGRLDHLPPYFPVDGSRLIVLRR